MDRPGGEIPVDALTRFAAAEARLYPMVLTDPDGYQRAATLVGIVADELRRSSADLAGVLGQRTELIDQVPRLAEAAGLDPAGLPVDALVDAASALRCRELGATGSGAFWGA